MNFYKSLILMLNHHSQQPEKNPTDQAATQYSLQPRSAGEARVMFDGEVQQVLWIGFRSVPHTHFLFIVPLTFSLPIFRFPNLKAWRRNSNISTLTYTEVAEFVHLPTSFF